MKKKYMILLGALSLASSTFAQTWIWYPGDYEIWLGNQMNNRRTERGAFFPPFWKTDSHYVVVEFSKQLNLSEPEEIFIAAEGKYNVKLDGKLQFGMPETMLLPAGKHSLNIKVWNQATPPTIYVKGKTVNSDSSWRVTYEDKEWIDESGKASDTSATIYMDAGCWKRPVGTSAQAFIPTITVLWSRSLNALRSCRYPEEGPDNSECMSFACGSVHPEHPQSPAASAKIINIFFIVLSVFGFTVEPQTCSHIIRSFKEVVHCIFMVCFIGGRFIFRIWHPACTGSCI